MYEQTSVVMAPNATHHCNLSLVRAEGLGMAGPCTLSIPGRWTGPANCETEFSGESAQYANSVMTHYEAFSFFVFSHFYIVHYYSFSGTTHFSSIITYYYATITTYYENYFYI